MTNCLSLLLWPPVCAICGEESEGRVDVHRRCLQSLERCRRSAGSIQAQFRDGPGWFRLLHEWKYGGRRGLAGIVADAMLGSGPDWPVRAVLVPVPDDPHRRRKRGYGPVADLAVALGAATGCPVDARLLRRAGPRPSQTTCRDDAQRYGNVRDQFRVGELWRWPTSRTLVLVDDQITSGATLLEAARCLGFRGHRVQARCAARSARAPRSLA